MKRALPFHSNTVWPPVWMVAIAFVIYGVLTCGFWLLQLKWGTYVAGFSDSPTKSKVLAVVLEVAAMVYAAHRLWRFHPACSRAYSTWLSLSPWTFKKPLPVGPVLLVWQDAAVIGILAAIAQLHLHEDPTEPLVAFGFTYLLGMTILLAYTRVWPAVLALAFLWPASFLPGMNDWPGMIVVLAMVLVIWWGHLKSLRTFPWRSWITANTLSAVADGKSNLTKEISLSGDAFLGWPYRALSPKFKRGPIPFPTSFWLSVIGGWWLYCVLKNSDAQADPVIIWPFAVLGAVGRLAIYCSCAAPPFNVWGRLVSGRIILPGFDQVFLTPIAAVLVGIIAGMVTRWSGTWYPVAESSMIGLLLFVLLSGGPSLTHWLLTGQVRFRPAPANKNSPRLRRV